MVDDQAPGIKEFFKGRDIFITGGSGKYTVKQFFQKYRYTTMKSVKVLKQKIVCAFFKVLWAKC